MIQVMKGRARDLGGGFQVSRVLPGHPQQMVGPFIFFDQMGPLTVAPEDMEPAFSHHPAASLPKIRVPGVHLTLIAGGMFGEKSPAPAYSKMFYVAAELDAGASLRLPVGHEERGAYLVQGDILVDGVPLVERNLAFVSSNERIEIQAKAQSRVMLLGGEKMDGQRFIWWNFVASSKQRIEQAKQRWREQRFPAVPGETEFIPLPER